MRLQWDPDRDPQGRPPLERRAIQLGLRGTVLRRYGEREILSIEDFTPFVGEQALIFRRAPEELRVPVERVYRPE